MYACLHIILRGNELYVYTYTRIYAYIYASFRAGVTQQCIDIYAYITLCIFYTYIRLYYIHIRLHITRVYALLRCTRTERYIYIYILIYTRICIYEELVSYAMGREKELCERVGVGVGVRERSQVRIIRLFCRI